MNWYQKFKTAAPLLDIDNKYPKNRNKAIQRLDKYIQENTKKKLDEERKRTYLNHGEYGIAYSIPEGYVEKITSDESEYFAALKIIQLQKENGGILPYVVNVHSIEQIQEEIPSENNQYIPNLYRLILEKVIPINKSQIKFFNSNIYKILDGYDTKEYDRDVNYTDPKINQFVKCMIVLAEKIKQYNVPQYDLKGENIGWRNNELVILDLGALDSMYLENFWKT